MLSGKDIICFSSIDWDFNWQGHQEIMSRLANEGNRVLFIENTGIRAPRWGDLPRLWIRLRHWFRSTYGIREVRPGLFVYSPLFLPFPYNRWACSINRLLFMIILKPWFRATRFQNSIVWTFLPTRLALSLIEALKPNLLIYYCIADFERLHSNPQKVRRYEERLVRMADLIFAQGAELRRRCAQWNERVEIFPFGVNVELFTDTSAPPPSELRSINRPILGYLGGLHRHFDVSLVRKLAEIRPDWSIVLVGPEQESVASLSALPNVHVLGPRPHEDVPAYVKEFDVCLIPYLLNPYTATVYPTKLTEYLVMGKPVVSTPLPEVEAFNRRHNDVVRMARAPEAFVQAVNDLMKNNGTLNGRLREEIALEYSWKSIVARMTEIVDATLKLKKSSLQKGWQTTFVTAVRRLQLRAATLLLVLVLAYGILFYTPLVWLLAEPLRIQQSPRQADVIAVFGGGVGEAGRPGESTVERARFGANLYLSGFAPHIVFSSGYVYKSNDAEDMKLIAMSMGVQNDFIVLEQKANSAYENVRYVAQMAREKGWRSLLVVSSPYNMRRVQLVFKKWGDGLTVTYTPLPNPKFYDPEQGSRWAQLRAILHEYLGMLYYWWKGWI